MSLDMFVMAISEEESHKFPRAIVERAFAPITQDVKDTDYCLLLKSGEDSGVDMTVEAGQTIGSISINRPPAYGGFPQFWDAIFEVMRQTPTYCIVLGAGADANCCLANPATLDELPADFAEDFGEVRLVSSAAELEAALCE